jgi:hypothetical protein
MPCVAEGTAARVVRALLADGSIVRMRELHSADAPLVEQVYRALPTYDRYLRFFSAGVVPRADDWARGAGVRGAGDRAAGADRLR